MTKLELKNGSIIYCLPAGKTGAFIRGFTADFIIADEAARIPNEVFVSIEPMLLAQKKLRGTGWMILLSTPTTKDTYFYQCCKDPDFLEIHVTSEQCGRLNKKDLKKKKARLTAMEYAQEYLGEFTEGFSRYFQEQVIKRCPKIESWSLEQKKLGANYYLGVDVARFGKDSNAFVVAEIEEKKIRIVYAGITRRKELTDTAGRVWELNSKFNFKKIYIDGTGVGGGVVDILKEKMPRFKIVETNAITRVISGDKNAKTLKEDLYSTALINMENGRVELLQDKNLIFSLRGITFDYTSSGNLKIYGHEDHLAEAFVRACYGIKEHRKFLLM
jgi:hypothetical protein